MRSSISSPRQHSPTSRPTPSRSGAGASPTASRSSWPARRHGRARSCARRCARTAAARNPPSWDATAFRRGPRQRPWSTRRAATRTTTTIRSCQPRRIASSASSRTRPFPLSRRRLLSASAFASPAARCSRPFSSGSRSKARSPTLSIRRITRRAFTRPARSARSVRWPRPRSCSGSIARRSPTPSASPRACRPAFVSASAR